MGNEEVLICSLREGGQETTNLDLILDTYTELSLATKAKNTKASIHVAGYLIAESEEEEEEDDEDAGTCCGLDHDHHHHHDHLQGQHRSCKPCICLWTCIPHIADHRSHSPISRMTVGNIFRCLHEIASSMPVANVNGDSISCLLLTRAFTVCYPACLNGLQVNVNGMTVRLPFCRAARSPAGSDARAATGLHER